MAISHEQTIHFDEPVNIFELVEVSVSCHSGFRLLHVKLTALIITASWWAARRFQRPDVSRVQASAYFGGGSSVICHRLVLCMVGSLNGGSLDALIEHPCSIIVSLLITS